MTRKSDLPFGSEFSPSTIDLAAVLEIIDQNGGDQVAVESTLKKRFFDRETTSERNRQKLAMNLRLSLLAYGLMDAHCYPTEFGKRLHSIREDVAELHKELARHILLNLHGLTLIQCLKDMELGGEAVTLVSLRQWLDERGVHFPRGGKHPSMMRLWLEKAGVFSSGWRVNEDRVKELTGTSTEDLEVLSQASPEQRAFLKALANLGSDAVYFSNEIEKLASITYGVEFNEKGLARDVLYPLESAGFITLERGTKEPGRGAKPFVVTPTAKFQAEVLLPILEQIEQQTHADLRPLLRKPLTDVLSELDHDHKHIRGLALEALAIRLMRTVGLDYVATRLRGEATGGAEVDVIFESTRLVFTRWQVQCKNTARVSLDDVAKEVGLTHTLKSNAIVIVGTGQISDAARRYANRVMADSNLAIIMMDKGDVQAIARSPATIVSILKREATHALELKKLDGLR
jgi:hypothetical protein